MTKSSAKADLPPTGRAGLPTGQAGKKTLTAEEREDLLRASWYDHDSRWYAAVADAIGFEVANRLNSRAVRALAKAEMRRLATRLGVKAPSTIEELVSLLETARDLYVPPPLMKVEFRIVDDSSYEIELDECFVARHVVKARMARHYLCAVPERIAGWHEALGLPLRQRPPALSCTLVRGLGCRRQFQVQWTKAGRDGDKGG
jgi:hypothetical protein